MAISDDALWQEINGDPLGRGYAALTDAPCADLLNAKAYALTVSEIPVTQFEYIVSDLLAAVDALPDGNPYKAPILAAYQQQAPLLTSVPTVHLTGTALQGIFGLLVSAGVVTAQQVAAYSQVPASRAEVLWGVGATVGFLDVGRVRVAHSGGNGQ